MAEIVRHLASSCAFTSLQNKIDRINDNFAFSSCSTNLSRLCDLSESLAKFQDQLLNAMSSTASSGGSSCDVDAIRSRLVCGSKPDNCLVRESLVKDREICRLKKAHREEILKLEGDLKFAQKQLRLIREELSSGQAEIEKSKRGLSGTMRPTEQIIFLRSELRIAKDEAARYKARLDLMGNYERDICRLRDEVGLLRSERDLLEVRLGRSRARSCSPPRRRYSPPCRSFSPPCYSYTPRPRSPCDYPLSSPPARPTRAELTNSIRHSRLLARFNDLYAINRLDMQDRLRRFVFDDDMVKKIIFIAVCESFHVAKMAYRAFRLRARRMLSPNYIGPSSLEEAVTDYIVRNFDLYDVDRSVDDVIRAMNVNPKISFPPECEFVLLSPFIRETCKIAYEMQALDPVLDIAFATDGELYNESRYRRNYDSEFSAPLVAFHMWPALLEGSHVLVKGECITRHGAKRGRSRSSSPRPCSY